MKTSLIASLGLIAGGFAGAAHAQEVSAAPPAAKSDTPATPANKPDVPAPLATPSDVPAPPAAKPDASAKPDGASKSDAKSDKKDDAENRVRLEFDSKRRQQTAFYSNTSQARLKVYAVNRFDPEIAKTREYFLLELNGAAIIEPLKLDADDAASVNAIISVLERFQSEAEKSGKLKEDMIKRKISLEGDLSREETRLVELQSASSPDVTAIDASKAKVTKLKDDLTLAAEIGSMEKISGIMGKAKVNLDRPAYEFVASFEPGKSLYTLSAGYSFQVASKDVKYYVDLLKRTQEFKSMLLDNESKEKKLRQEVDSIFKEKKL